MGRFAEQVIQELAEIKQEIAVKNVLLERLTITVEKHEQRSTLLEARIIPIEQHVMFIKMTIRLTAWLAAFTASLAAIYKYLLR